MSQNPGTRMVPQVGLWMFIPPKHGNTIGSDPSPYLTIQLIIPLNNPILSRHFQARHFQVPRVEPSFAKATPFLPWEAVASWGCPPTWLVGEAQTNGVFPWENHRNRFNKWDKYRTIPLWMKTFMDFSINHLLEWVDYVLPRLIVWLAGGLYKYIYIYIMCVWII